MQHSVSCSGVEIVSEVRAVGLICSRLDLPFWYARICITFLTAEAEHEPRLYLTVLYRSTERNRVHGVCVYAVLAPNE